MSHWENTGKTNEWYTPKYIFDALDCEFDVDVASAENRIYCHVPAKRHITQRSDNQEWEGFVWMNPPFGGRNKIGEWLDKIKLHGNGIALTPDRTSATWWQKAAHESDAILFIHQKIRFIKPDGTNGNHPSNGTTLFAYGYEAVKALQNAQKNNLGILLKR